MMRIVILLMALAILPAPAFANPLNNAKALEGLETVKMVVDVNVGDPELLLKRFELIDETYTQLIDDGIRPTIVVAFRGPATKYVTRGTKYVSSKQQALKEKIQGWIAQFHENGFTLELCAIAARGQKVEYGDVLPDITVVQNSYISLVAYQNKGYALLPMD